VLLPPAFDLTSEIFDYARLVCRRVHLLAEFTYSELLREEMTSGYPAAGAVPHVLPVGEATEVEGAAFVAARLKMAASRWPNVSVVTPADVMRIMVGGRSIGFLQQLFFGVYQELANREELSYREEISYADVTGYYFRQQLGGRTSDRMDR
jgi:hypothetical protein